MASNVLLEKAYNCYIAYLDNLNYGKVTQNYCLLYDAILMIANDITDQQYVEYFESNLDCNRRYVLNITDDMGRQILWTLNDSEVVLGNFNWTTIDAPINTTYQFTTNSLGGFNYVYISVPQTVNMLIFNELNVQIQDSLAPGTNPNQLFTLVGTMTLENGNTNNVWKKKDVYNTINPVLFKVKIY